MRLILFFATLMLLSACSISHPAKTANAHPQTRREMEASLPWGYQRETISLSGQTSGSLSTIRQTDLYTLRDGSEVSVAYRPKKLPSVGEMVAVDSFCKPHPDDAVLKIERSQGTRS